MKDLIDTYQRRIETLEKELKDLPLSELGEKETRLVTKLGCYRTFLSELKRNDTEHPGTVEPIPGKLVTSDPAVIGMLQSFPERREWPMVSEPERAACLKVQS